MKWQMLIPGIFHKQTRESSIREEGDWSPLRDGELPLVDGIEGQKAYWIADVPLRYVHEARSILKRSGLFYLAPRGVCHVKTPDGMPNFYNLRQAFFLPEATEINAPTLRAHISFVRQQLKNLGK